VKALYSLLNNKLLLSLIVVTIATVGIVGRLSIPWMWEGSQEGIVQLSA
jgi:hypothetical protein